MNKIALPSHSEGKKNDGQIMKWPDRCHTCKTQECQFATPEISLCSYGFNYVKIDDLFLAGFICPDHSSSSPAKSKNLKQSKSQAISTHQLNQQIAFLKGLSSKKQQVHEALKNEAREEFLNTESFKDEFIYEIREDILRGLSFVHDYKQINATISQNINVIIETNCSGNDFEQKLEKASQQEQAIYWASKFLQEKLNVAKYLLNPDWITRESEKVSFRFHGLTLKYIRLYTDLFKKKGINLQVSGTNYKNIVANPEAISVIVQTFLDNAHKYSKKNGKVDVFFSDEQDHVLFLVGSYGPRIRDDERDLIFQPFKRARDAIKSQEEGAGYGLYISQLIANRIGTVIEMEQDPQLKERQGHWTVFSIRIPTNTWR